MKAIIFSDLHLHVWSKFNQNNKRLKAQLNIITKLVKLSHKHRVPILFGGDLFHLPEGLSNELLSMVLPYLVQLFNTYPRAKMYAISGNHDFSEKNSFEKRSPSYINTLANSIENFICIDFDDVSFEDFTVHGIPYIHGNKDYPKLLNDIKLNPGTKNILLNHCDYAGQQDVGGIVVGKGENINEGQLKKFDLVLSGHIHKGGVVRSGIYSLGSPIQTRVSDMDHEFGYWIINDDFKMIFHPIDDAPKFRYYEKESDIDNEVDMWVKKPVAQTAITNKAERSVDLSDKRGIIEEYIKVHEITDRKKKEFLRELVW